MELIQEDDALQERILPDRPEIMAQIPFAITEELANTLRDVFIRRTQIFFRAHDQGLSAVDRVAGYMATLLHWDEERIEQEKQAYIAEVERSRAWQDE